VDYGDVTAVGMARADNWLSPDRIGLDRKTKFPLCRAVCRAVSRGAAVAR
jgi:hypothetical protein